MIFGRVAATVVSRYGELVSVPWAVCWKMEVKLVQCITE